MLKLLSSDWIAAEIENRGIRDQRRKQFWDELGLKRATDLNQMEIEPEQKLDNIFQLIAKTDEHLLDEEFKQVQARALQLLHDLGPGSVPLAGQGRPLTIRDVGIETFRDFFSEQVLPFFTSARTR